LRRPTTTTRQCHPSPYVPSLRTEHGIHLLLRCVLYCAVWLQAGFAASGHPAVRAELDLVEDEDQITHEMSLEDKHDPQV
jgi:hypothetical protein